MHEHSLGLLDFFRIRSTVQGYTRSHEGTALIAECHPYTTPADVLKEQACVRDVFLQFQKNKYLAPTQSPDIRPLLPKLTKEGSVLEIEELFALGLWAKMYESFISFFSEIKNSTITALIEQAPKLSEVIRTVFHILNEDGSVRELSELKPFLGKIRRLEQDIQKISASMCSDKELKAILQNDIPTLRDGRTVLAVKITYKSRVPGIVHEISDTGQTAFIEPEILVQKNNELVEAEAEYQRELLAILRKSTAIISTHGQAILEARAILGKLDVWHAKAHYSLVCKGVFIEYAEHAIEIYHAQHPLLGASAVPISIVLPEKKRELIITGPNTGGKTVTLKTMGLFALMNQFGLALPVAEGSRLPVFETVLVDLGDEQSIDASLSTFSAHIKTIAEITAQATQNSLILLDELGSGTDPEEGGALAMALLDYFRERKCTVFVTSHLSVLKNYAYNHEETINGSVEFDKATLCPTYKLIIGFPGESHALTIAERYGIPAPIIETAKTYCSQNQSDVSKLLKELHEKYQELESKHYVLDKTRQELNEQKRKLDLEALKLKQEFHTLKTREGTELRQFLTESRKTLENLVRMIQEGTITKDKTQAVKQFLSDLDAKVQEAHETLEAEAKSFISDDAPNTAGMELTPGTAVNIVSSKKEGVLIRKVKNNAWIVAIDSLKLTIQESDLVPIAPRLQRPSTSVEASTPENARSLLELDLRGFRLAEALASVEQQLNAAIIAHLNTFSIIHGTGEGILQKGIHEFLKKQPLVADYYFARPEEGGFGKTIVVLKS